MGGLQLCSRGYPPRPGVTLIVTVDCGITAVEEARYAAGARAWIWPGYGPSRVQGGIRPPPAGGGTPAKHRPIPSSPWAGGAAPKLELALGEMGGAAHAPRQYADWLGHRHGWADVMLLTGENRSIVQMDSPPPPAGLRPGRRPAAEAGLAESPLTSMLSDTPPGPCINAAGRMGCAGWQPSCSLTATRCGEELAMGCSLNRERQSIEGGYLCTVCPPWPRERAAGGAQRSGPWPERGTQGVVGSGLPPVEAGTPCPTFASASQ